MSLSAMGTQLPYRKALKECGMGDIFEENALAELDSRVREKMGLSEEAPLEPGADGMQAPENLSLIHILANVPPFLNGLVRGVVILVAVLAQTKKKNK